MNVLYKDKLFSLLQFKNYNRLFLRFDDKKYITKNIKFSEYISID